MKALTPTEYAQIHWGGTITAQTVRNWIKSGRGLKGVERIETTPTGHYALFMKGEVKSNAQSLAEMMKAKVA